jgi:hypothetical protein
MIKTAGTACLVCMLVIARPPQRDTDSLIFPDPDRKICIVQADGTREGMRSGKVLSPDSGLAEKVKKELDLPFHQSVVKLSQCSRNFVSDREGPNVLFLSQNEGGFPRQGLVLADGGKITVLPNLFYVDLVLDEERLARGDLDIFSHELGHVMMLNIWRHIPDQRSNKMHLSMGITDYTTAVFEGWGIHFQPLANDNIPLYAEKHRGNLDYSRAGNRAWHSNVDQDLRIKGVPENVFIHQKLLPDLEGRELDLEEQILLEHASPIFDRTRLRSGQQMLSCEGVLATLFYRINTNSALKQSYRPRDFYDRFLLRPLPRGTKPRDIFTPFENVVLKNFWVWSRLNDRMTEESVLPLEYIKEWAVSFPEDKEEIYRIFVLTTMGKTVSDGLGDVYEQMSFSGMQGDIQKYREALGKFRAAFKDLIGKVLAGEAALGANVGPQLWIKNEDFLMRRALWDASNKRPFWINLNTASALELASFPGISLDQARNIVAERSENGDFSSFEDAAARGLKVRTTERGNNEPNGPAPPRQ